MDALHWLQWSKTKDGSKNRNRPKTVLPVDKKTRREQNQSRPGAAPTPAPLSQIKADMPGRNLSQRDRQQRLSSLFK